MLQIDVILKWEFSNRISFLYYFELETAVLSFFEIQGRSQIFCLKFGVRPLEGDGGSINLFSNIFEF